MKKMEMEILGIPKEESQKCDLEVLFESLEKGNKRKNRESNERAMRNYIDRITERAKMRFSGI